MFQLQKQISRQILNSTKFSKGQNFCETRFSVNTISNTHNAKSGLNSRNLRKQLGGVGGGGDGGIFDPNPQIKETIYWFSDTADSYCCWQSEKRKPRYQQSPQSNSGHQLFLDVNAWWYNHYGDNVKQFFWCFLC